MGIDKEQILLLTYLGKIKLLYHQALEMTYEEKERMALNYFSAAGEGPLKKTFSQIIYVKDACDKTLEVYPLGVYPCEALCGERKPECEGCGGLIEYAKTLLPKGYAKMFPKTGFDLDILIYMIHAQVIYGLFEKVDTTEIEEISGVYFTEKLKTAIERIFMTNPNFQSKNSAYRMDKALYLQAKKKWANDLDHDFNNVIDYFSSVN